MFKKMIIWLLPIILFANTANLVFKDNLKNKETQYFELYKNMRDKFPKGTVFVARKASAFYFFTGYKTVR